MRVAVAQVTSGSDPEANLATVSQWTARAAAAGADLVVFPEAMQSSFAQAPATVAEPPGGLWAQQIAQLAAEHRIGVLAGMFTTAGDRVFNTLLAASDQANVSYHKIHLYDAFGFRESDTIAPGDQPVLWPVAGTSAGLATCYDIRFPSLFTWYAEAGADLMIVAASWADGPGKAAQWRALAIARALDSASFVVACDQAGPSSSDTKAPLGVGGSLVINPYGEVLAEAGTDEELLVVDLDLGAIGTARADLGVLTNRVALPRQ